MERVDQIFGRKLILSTRLQHLQCYGLTIRTVEIAGSEPEPRARRITMDLGILRLAEWQGTVLSEGLQAIAIELQELSDEQAQWEADKRDSQAEADEGQDAVNIVFPSGPGLMIASRNLAKHSAASMDLVKQFMGSQTHEETMGTWCALKERILAEHPGKDERWALEQIGLLMAIAAVRP